MAKAWIGIGMDDVPHLTERKKQETLSGVAKHEINARRNGTPMVGSGLIFRQPDADITCSPFAIPAYFARIAGIDFGIDHPTAGAWLAWDMDKDVVFLTDVYSRNAQIPVVHAEAFKKRGAWIPVAWPHDGMVRDKGSGIQLAQIYRDHGMNLLPMHFENPEGGQGVWAGLTEMNERFDTARLVVFETCEEFFDEKRTYHRKDNEIVKQRDDVICAMRYALMSLRFAQTKPVPVQYRRTYRPADRVGGY